MANQFVLRYGGRGRFCDFEQATAFQEPDSGLDGGFRQSTVFGQLLEAELGAALLQPEQGGPENHIDQEGAGRMIMFGEVGQENVEHILVDSDMVHNTIVINIIDPLHFFPQSNRITP